MLTQILQTKLLERENICSDRMKFRAVYSGKNAKIIGEIKPRTPGSEEFTDAKIIAQRLLENPNIAGYSILIDQTFFGGDIRNIELVRHTSKPSLFKEFVTETSQIDGASYYGYDSVLLIRKMFGGAVPPCERGMSLGQGDCENINLQTLVKYCLSKNIEPLIEIDNEADLEEVLENFSPEEISIGINCRDLDTMYIDRENHFKLWRPELQKYHTIALSGITDLHQVSEYQGKYDGLVIGTLFTDQNFI